MVENLLTPVMSYLVYTIHLQFRFFKPRTTDTDYKPLMLMKILDVSASKVNLVH